MIKLLSLFPYTPLFRSSGMHTEGDGFFTRSLVKPLLNTFLKHGWADMLAMEDVVTASGVDWTVVRPPMLLNGRSEEHTSELQSHVNLVCRLLLAKTKAL